MVWQVFDNLRTGSPNAHDDVWVSSGTSYDSGNSWNANTVRQLATNTEYGEWLKLKLPDKRKLVAYKLSRQDYTSYDSSPRKFRLYGSNNDISWTEIAGSAVTRGATDPINAYSASPNADAASGSRFDLSTVSPAYQYFALVIEQTHNYQRTALHEFELFCQPASIENFKLYGSPDNSSWTLIHDQNTSANITSSGTDFTITNSNSYQHYGLVITKNGGYHNVSLAEMKLGVTESVDLSNYYNKTETYSKAELDPRIAKAKGSVSIGLDAAGGGNGPLNLINHYKVSNVARSLYNGINASVMWGGLSTQISVYEHTVTFDAGVFDDDENYVVLLTPHGTGGNTYGVNRVMSLEIKEKHYTHFITTCMVYEHNSTATGNNPWAFDFVVF